MRPLTMRPWFARQPVAVQYLVLVGTAAVAISAVMAIYVALGWGWDWFLFIAFSILFPVFWLLYVKRHERDPNTN